MNSNSKKILITGACGFIGSHLANALIKSGYKINAFDFQNSFSSNSNSLSFFRKNTDKFIFFPGNIEDPKSLNDAVKGVDHVFHLAARSFIPESWKKPYDFYRTNVIGTTNVLDTCRQNNCSLTYLSSYVYGVPAYIPIDEKHPLKSYNPYSHSKLIAEDICDYYKKNYGFKITIFRPFNIYGPGQNGIFLIPEIIEQLVSNEKKILEVNDLNPKRDYLYIDDLINALILSINSKDDIYNIGSGYSVSVEEIIKVAINVSGIGKKYVSKNINRQNEINDVIANISKIKKELGWSVKTTFEEGIKHCIDYYLQKN